MSKTMESSRYLAEAIEKWKALAAKDMGKAEDFAFAACGCEAAYPTWWAKADGTTEQVDCLHLGCRIRRGEFKRPNWLVLFTSMFRSEVDSGWLRFSKETFKGRTMIARLYWAMKRRKKFDIMACVWGGILGPES